MYTIQRELGHLENIRIGLVGDLANGRTARSLAFLLSMYKGVKMYFVAPDVVRMKDDIKSFFRSRVRRYRCLPHPVTPSLGSSNPSWVAGPLLWNLLAGSGQTSVARHVAIVQNLKK